MAATVSRTDKEFMAHALKLAEKGRGKTSPNPMVGALLVKNGQIIGEGYHRVAGSDHAEIIALKKAGRNAKGSTLYVTLEPCCHTGLTPPCTQKIIDADVKRVVFASADPDPRVNGQGAKILKKAGIEVKRSLLKREAEQLNEFHYSFYRKKRPFVILKWAQSLDGKIALKNGESKWITGVKARKEAHYLRSIVDGIMVGMETVRTDNPSLTVRDVKGKNPYRILLTTKDDIPRGCKLIKDNLDFKTIIATTGNNKNKPIISTKKSLISWDIKKAGKGRLDLEDLLKKAADFGLKSLLIEGGATLATSFLKAGLVDKIALFISPKIIGAGLNAIGELNLSNLSDAIKFDQQEFTMLGDDLLFTAYPKWSK